MGGVGSGRYLRWKGKKATTDAAMRLDIRWLRKSGYLVPGRGNTITYSIRGEKTGSIGCGMVDETQLVLAYRNTGPDGETQDVQELIPLEWTPCNYGGKRPWMRCPGCGRRVAVLYGVSVYFRCRHCYDLSYQTRQESFADRQLTKAHAIRKRLGSTDTLNVSLWSTPRPKHMRREIYYRLILEHSTAICGGLSAILQSCPKSNERAEKIMADYRRYKAKEKRGERREAQRRAELLKRAEESLSEPSPGS